MSVSLTSGKTRFFRRWACRHCSHVYIDPIGCLEAWHRCPKRDGRIVMLTGSDLVAS